MSGSRGAIGKIVGKLIMVIIRFEIICLTIGLWLGLLSSLSDFSNLCFKRYDFSSMTNATTYSIAATTTVRGDGNYTTISNTVNGQQVLSLDPTKYGQWIRANFIVQPGQTIKIAVSGNLSLCRAYVPLYNLQNQTIPAGPPATSTVNVLDVNGNTITVPNKYYVGANNKRIPIPRVEENVPPLTLIFDARTNGWRNLTEVYRGDLVKVILKDNFNPHPVTAPDRTTLTAADCTTAPASMRAACNNALNINNRQNITLAKCNSLSGDVKNSCCNSLTGADRTTCCNSLSGTAKTNCLAQISAPPAASLTVADCNAMDPSIRAACIAAIPTAAVTPAASSTPSAPAAPTAMNAQQTAAAASRDAIINTDLPAAELNRTQILNQINTQLDIDKQVEVDAAKHDFDIASNALKATRDADIATITASSDTPAQQEARITVVRDAYTTANDTLEKNGTSQLTEITNRYATRKTNLINQLAAADQNIAQLNATVTQYNEAITDLGSNTLKNIVTDSITNTPTIAACDEGRRTYSPICGRYSMWNGTQTYSVATSCGTWNRCSDDCNCHCPKGNPLCWGVDYCDHCSCLKVSQWDPLPPAYLDNGTRTEARFTNTAFMLEDFTTDPTTGTSTRNCTATIAPKPTKYWFSAHDAAGLQKRFDSQVYPTNPTAPVNSSVEWASILAPNTDPYPDQNTSRKIYSAIYGDKPIEYLQYRFHGSGYSSRMTGGYVLQLYQTKCRRVNGNFATDSFTNRGAVQYVVMPSGQNPNDPRNSSLVANPSTITFDGEGKKILSTGNNSGYFWFKIQNDPNDYPDSIGSYSLSISGQQIGGSFTINVIGPLFNVIRNRIYDISLGMFTNMICYKKEISSNCTNFFNYIRALLMLYVMTIGYRFLLGANIKQEELVKSLAKVAIVAGLINGKTFEYFREKIFPFVTGFSDQIISNMSGFSMISSTNSVSNPFMFMDALMSKMFLNPTFLFQVLTVMGMGLTGILFFIIICIAVIIFIIAIFRAMAIYVMALIATAFLIGMAPIFIVFILFDRTYYLFENWAKFLFKYMMEPVIVMAGIIILTQLFSLYVDEVLSYSLCWKCTIAFHVPFASLLPFPGLSDIPLFCIYWFGPWGLSPSNDTIGMNMAMMVGMAIVAYTAYGYVEFAAKMAERLCGAGGGPSSISMGGDMVHHMGQHVLKKYGLDDKSIAAAKEKLKAGLDNKKLDKAAAARGAAAGVGNAANAAKSSSKLSPTMASKSAGDDGSTPPAPKLTPRGSGGSDESATGSGTIPLAPPTSGGSSASAPATRPSAVPVPTTPSSGRDEGVTPPASTSAPVPGSDGGSTPSPGPTPAATTTPAPVSGDGDGARTSTTSGPSPAPSPSGDMSGAGGASNDVSSKSTDLSDKTSDTAPVTEPAKTDAVTPPTVVSPDEPSGKTSVVSNLGNSLKDIMTDERTSGITRDNVTPDKPTVNTEQNSSLFGGAKNQLTEDQTQQGKGGVIVEGGSDLGSQDFGPSHDSDTPAPKGGNLGNERAGPKGGSGGESDA